VNEEELRAKLAALGPLTDEQRREVTCALIGHSRICTVCFGYRYCGRCGGQLGDSIGSIDPGASDAVIVGHSCDTCRDNYAKCTWVDTLWAPDPKLEEAQ
jgi:hypothetical protein